MSSQKIKGPSYYEVINKIYNREFPKGTNSNDLLKLLLFLNEYVISNGLLQDGNNEENKAIFNKYSNIICRNITIDYPEEDDIDYMFIDKFVYNTKLIQRVWRKHKIRQFLGQSNYFKKGKVKIDKDNLINEELKKMVIQDFIKHNNLKVKKITGLFNTMVENYGLISNENFSQEMFHFVSKLTKGNISDGELNMLYKKYINKGILVKNKEGNKY